MPAAALKPPTSSTSNASWADHGFDLDDDGWEDMPVVRAGDNPLGLDDEDAKKYRYVQPEKYTSNSTNVNESHGNATGNLIDYDERGQEWRSKLEQNESEYTRLRLNDDDEADEAYLRTRYLFDEDQAMTPLSQMQQTKNLLTEAQRIAYVGLCALSIREMSQALKLVGSKELKTALHGMELWGLRIMGRLYYHMELETAEQKMIESLAEHGVCAADLVPSLMTTHTVRNPEYDPAEAREKEQRGAEVEEYDPEENPSHPIEIDLEEKSTLAVQDEPVPDVPSTASLQTPTFQTTQNVMTPKEPVAMPGVSTSLSSTDENVTLDIRWTVLCDLFLLLIADSVYDARSRVLLEKIAEKMGLGWLDVVKFEKRVTDALEIQEAAERLEHKDVIEGREAGSKKRRYMMVGLATLGGGLVIGLSAGLLAPVIGAGLGATLGMVGISGTTGFLASAGGAAVITTGGVLTGSSIAAKGMTRRTQQVKVFEILPLHNNKRVNCILTVSGFMSSAQDDVRLPFGVLDPTVGDVFSVLWEPEMMGETGNALKILTAEVLSQVGTTVLQATVMTALMSALQWPIILTKLGYLIDNPWSNALDRAVSAGGILADVLIHRSLGVRPISLIGFSLGARVIFYALLELAKRNAYGIVQDVFLLGATVTAPTKRWLEVRGVVAGRLVNGYARNDWILNYLFRASSGSLNTVAGLRPVDNVPGLQNIDLTDKIAGHMSYRIYMPIILDQLGFPVSATYFDEPEDLDVMWEKEYIREQEAKPKSSNRFSFWKRNKKSPSRATPPPGVSGSRSTTPRNSDDLDLPERVPKLSFEEKSKKPSVGLTTSRPSQTDDSVNGPKATAGFDFEAIAKVLQKEDLDPDKIKIPQPNRISPMPKAPTPPPRSESVPTPVTDTEITPTSTPRPARASLHEDYGEDVPAPKFTRSHSTAAAFTPSSNLSSVPSWSSKAWNPAHDVSSAGRPQLSSAHPPSSLETLSFGSFDGSVTTGYGPPATTLSFGSGDGTISSVSIGDPWASDARKATDEPKKSWNANPWS